MKKVGFTLAEVLLTLSIVGVLAAVTIPGVVSSSSNDANAARLAVTVSNIENAMHSMIATEGVSNLYGTRAWGVAQKQDKMIGHSSSSGDATGVPAFAGYLGQYLAINSFSKGSYIDYYGSNTAIRKLSGSKTYGEQEGGEATDYEGLGGRFPIELKNGATMFIQVWPRGDGNTKDTQAKKDAVIELGGSLFSDAADVSIDVNGKQKPNTIGRDIFKFYLGSDGVLYPCGGTDVSIYDYGSLKETWDSNDATVFGCLDSKVVNSGAGCTARLISNGYKFDY